MGKVPDWAMPMVVYSLIGFFAGAVAIIELLYLTGLLGAPHDATVSALVAVILGLVAIGGFAKSYGSWKNVQASWARDGMRLCMNCGRLSPVGSPLCTACGHGFP